jgi:hypothetical protein
MSDGKECVAMLGIYPHSLQDLQMPLCCFKAPKRLEWYAEVDILPTVTILKKKS